VTRFRVAHYLKTSLWLVPLLSVLGGIVLSLVTTSVDDGTLVSQRITGDPTAALQILYLISFAMLTLTAILLSLVVVAVQLAMGMFSPRIVRQVLHDRPSQLAIGLFAATFAHSMLAMRHVRSGPNGDGTVPGLAVMVAIVLVLCCIGTLVWYLNHIAQSLRTAALVAWVAKDTVTALQHVYPDNGQGLALGPDFIPSRDAGVIFTIGHERLVRLAQHANCQLDVLWAVGDFVPNGAALIRVIGDPTGLTTKTVARCVVLGPERTLNQDVAYGIRLLVDIAGRSLSAGPFADPTTVVQAIDRLHDIMRRLAHRPLHDGRYYDAAGTLRLTVPTLQWEGYVRIAFDEIRQAGAGSPQVSRRLSSALHDLLQVAPPERQLALSHQLALLTELAGSRSVTDTDREQATLPDPSGLGSAKELVKP